jgi:hypothetical protein
MRRLLIPALFLLVGLAYLQPVQAEDSATTAPAKVAPAGAMDTNSDGKVDADETAKEVAKDTRVGDVVTDVNAVVDATKGLKDKGADKAMVWMLILATVFKLALSGIKLIKSKTQWFAKKKAKAIIKYSTLGLGALAALLFNVVGGMGWLEAGMIFLSGPVAVAIHEYTKDSKDDPASTPTPT